MAERDMSEWGGREVTPGLSVSGQKSAVSVILALSSLALSVWTPSAVCNENEKL